jgi:DNA-binding NtrC family response regulator/tetratricopeptide (TPR) repeat protein
MNPACHTDPFDSLLGESAALSVIKDRLRKLLSRPIDSGRPVPFLLLGETGTGKGLLAKAIHDASVRAAGPFVSVNCAAIPEPLIESELFGFERGAFTDARQGKPGLFHQAGGGTLFLDEVGLLPLAAQAKLLTAVEERRVRRLGGVRNEAVEASIVAATSVDLEAATQRGLFREDLYYRLAVLPVRLPPLRERGADILLLARHFLARACQDYGYAPRTLAPDACALLMAHAWPGNIRELANMMERVVLVSDAQVITADLLSGWAQVSRESSDGPQWPAHAASEDHSRDAAGVGAPGAQAGFRSSIDRFERAQLVEALAKTHGNLARTARLLGIPRNTLKYRMRKHGLRPVRAVGPIHHPAPAHAEGLPSVAPTPPPWEMRTVTFFRATIDTSADVGGHTAAGRVLAECVTKVDAFAGQLLEVSSSGILAGFGIEPTEDSAASAANAALVITRAVARAGGNGTLHAKISLHTVRCGVAGLSEGSSRMDSEVLREAKATTATLLAAEGSDGIILSQTTARLLERRFTITPVASSVGGSSATLVGREWTGFGVGGRPLSPFVGRQPELETLLHLLQRAEHGQGGVVSVAGGPGSGKSRLLYELRTRMSVSGFGLVELRCAPHGSGVPYLPFVDLLHHELGLDEDARADGGSTALPRRLDALHLDHEIAPYLESLLGVDSSADPLGALSLDRRKRGTIDALTRFLLAPGRGRPLAIFVEDVHWIDRASEEFLSFLVDSIPAARAMLIMSHRPGSRPRWLDRSHTAQISLLPLTAEASRHVARAVLAANVESSDLESSIVARGEGNPFFIEELAWAARQPADRPATSEVPATIEGVLGCRIDRLSASLRRLLTIAAVIGRELSEPILQAVWAEEGLVEHLDELVRLEFLRAQPGTGYAFKHALTQEVAYSKLAAGERRKLHVAVARAIEGAHAARLENVYDLLAYHYVRTDETEKAVEYLERLAGQATQRYALPEADAAYEQALSLAEGLPEGESRDRRVSELVIEACFPLVLLGKFAAVHRLLRACGERLERWRDSRLIARYHFYLGVAYDHTGDYAKAEECCLRAIEEAQASGESATIGQAYMILTTSSCWAGEFRKGVERGVLAVRNLTGTGDSFFRGMAFHIKAWNHFLLGEFQEALASGTEARRIGEASGDRRIESYGTVMAGWVALRQGNVSGAIETCRRAVAMAPDPLARAVVLGILAEAYLGAQDFQQAIPLVEEALGLLRTFGFASLEAWNLARLAEAHLMAGHHDRAREAAEQALAMSTARRYPYPRGLAERLLGRLARAEGRIDEGVKWLGTARETFRRMEARFDEASTHP